MADARLRVDQHGCDRHRGVLSAGDGMDLDGIEHPVGVTPQAIGHHDGDFKQGHRDSVLAGDGTGEGNRTPVFGMGNRRSTIELHPRMRPAGWLTPGR
jgi:hypothetical protein